MRRTSAIVVCWLALIVVVTALYACTDMEEGDVDPPGADDDDAWECDIDVGDAEPVDFVAACQDPAGVNDALEVDRVRGTDAVVADGARFTLSGTYSFPTRQSGKIEPVILCPGDGAYRKCSAAFDAATGDYEVRLAADACGDLAKPEEITLNVYDDAEATTHSLCVITLGAASDDDSADEWECDIDDADLKPVFFQAACTDTPGVSVTVQAVLGTAPLLADGVRFEIRGAYSFTDIAAGKFEPVIGCPSGSAYGKCSWPFVSPTGEFRVRVDAEECGDISDTDILQLNLWDTANGVLMPLCDITLVPPPAA